jgi:hypothetical protein
MFENPVPALGASFALSGPAAKPDPASVPVRGDVAHIRLAGKVLCRIMWYRCRIAHAGDITILKTPGGDVWPLLARALNLTCSIWRAAMPGRSARRRGRLCRPDQLEKRHGYSVFIDGAAGTTGLKSPTGWGPASST